MSDKIFDQLVAHLRDTQKLSSIKALLDWDQQTKLPVAGNGYRAEQLMMLAGEIHKRNTDPRIGEWLHELESELDTAEPHGDRWATVRETRRQFDKNTKLSTELVEALTRCSALGHQVWVEARQENDFEKFAPCLEEMVKLKIEVAEASGYEDSPYDVLLDDYEPGAKTSEVASVLDGLKNELVPLIEAIRGATHAPDVEILSRKFPQQQQEQFARNASRQIGFNYDRGRLDSAHHPFCTELGPDDVRITTRFDESFFNMCFFGTLHEAGHGMYEQGLRAKQYGLPPGRYCSLGIHESQSRLWENIVGRSAAFWDYFFPLAQQQFECLSDVNVEQFFHAVNDVRPSLIRVEADEATYNLHIIIRFELEQELLNRQLSVKDLPTAWNDRYQRYLGISPDSDANGVLQDIHWSAGLFGYFPTYSLGNLYASQIYAQAESEIGGMDGNFRRGKFDDLLEWLRDNIHKQGASYRASELVMKVAGGPIDHTPLIQYLTKKLKPIYQL